VQVQVQVQEAHTVPERGLEQDMGQVVDSEVVWEAEAEASSIRLGGIGMLLQVEASHLELSSVHRLSKSMDRR
jgi:hypothetical protein